MHEEYLLMQAQKKPKRKRKRRSNNQDSSDDEHSSDDALSSSSSQDSQSSPGRDSDESGSSHNAYRQRQQIYTNLLQQQVFAGSHEAYQNELSNLSQMDVHGISDLTVAPVSRFTASASQQQLSQGFGYSGKSNQGLQSLKQRRSILKFRRSKRSFKLRRSDSENYNENDNDENKFISSNPLTSVLNSTESSEY